MSDEHISGFLQKQILHWEDNLKKRKEKLDKLKDDIAKWQHEQGGYEYMVEEAETILEFLRRRLNFTEG